MVHSIGPEQDDPTRGNPPQDPPMEFPRPPNEPDRKDPRAKPEPTKPATRPTADVERPARPAGERSNASE